MIYLFLAQGCEEIEALCPLDLLRRAGLAVTTVGIGGTRITGSHGITMEADIADVAFDDKAPEAIILPGGMPGVENLYACDGLKKVLRTHMSHGKLTAAICAAPMVLGRLNLLNNHRVTCYPGCEADLYGAKYTGAAVETSTTLITANGPGAAMAFAFAIARRFAPTSVVRRVKDALMLPTPVAQSL